MKTANEAIVEIRKDEDLNLTEVSHLFYAAVIVFTGEENGTGYYKPETHSPKTLLWVRRLQERV